MLKIKAFLRRYGLLATKETVPECSNCTICFDLVNVKDEVMIALRLPCGHIFHKDCILRWLTCNCVCPNCRRVVDYVPPNNCPNLDESPEQQAGPLLWPRGRPPVSTYMNQTEPNTNDNPSP